MIYTIIGRSRYCSALTIEGFRISRVVLEVGNHIRPARVDDAARLEHVEVDNVTFQRVIAQHEIGAPVLETDPPHLSLDIRNLGLDRAHPDLDLFVQAGVLDDFGGDRREQRVLLHGQQRAVVWQVTGDPERAVAAVSPNLQASERNLTECTRTRVPVAVVGCAVLDHRLAHLQSERDLSIAGMYIQRSERDLSIAGMYIVCRAGRRLAHLLLDVLAACPPLSLDIRVGNAQHIRPKRVHRVQHRLWVPRLSMRHNMLKKVALMSMQPIGAEFADLVFEM